MQILFEILSVLGFSVILAVVFLSVSAFFQWRAEKKLQSWAAVWKCPECRELFGADVVVNEVEIVLNPNPGPNRKGSLHELHCPRCKRSWLFWSNGVFYRHGRSR